MVEKLVPDPFVNFQNWTNLSINSLKCYEFFFIVCLSKSRSTKILKLRPWPLLFILYKTLELVSLLHLQHQFWRKTSLLLYSINGPKFVAWLSLLLEILDNMCIVIIYRLLQQREISWILRKKWDFSKLTERTS